MVLLALEGTVGRAQEHSLEAKNLAPRHFEFLGLQRALVLAATLQSQSLALRQSTCLSPPNAGAQILLVESGAGVIFCA